MTWDSKRPPMAEHTARAFVGAYATWLATRSRRLPWMTPMTAEQVYDRYYTETGKNAEREPEHFRKWAGHKLFLAEQLSTDPFAGEAA
jgi:hypothetical protein